MEELRGGCRVSGVNNNFLNGMITVAIVVISLFILDGLKSAGVDSVYAWLIVFLFAFVLGLGWGRVRDWLTSGQEDT